MKGKNSKEYEVQTAIMQEANRNKTSDNTCQAPIVYCAAALHAHTHTHTHTRTALPQVIIEGAKDNITGQMGTMLGITGRHDETMRCKV